MRRDAQDGSAGGGGLAVALAVIGRDSHVVGRGRGSPVVVALQALYAMIRDNKVNRKMANDLGSLNLLATKGLVYHASSSSVGGAQAKDTHKDTHKGGKQSSNDKRPKVPARDDQTGSAVKANNLMIALAVIDAEAAVVAAAAAAQLEQEKADRKSNSRGSTPKSRPGSQKGSNRPGTSSTGVNTRPSSRNSDRPLTSSDPVKRPLTPNEACETTAKWKPGDPLPHVVPILPSNKPTTSW